MGVRNPLYMLYIYRLFAAFKALSILYMAVCTVCLYETRHNRKGRKHAPFKIHERFKPTSPHATAFTGTETADWPQVFVSP